MIPDLAGGAKTAAICWVLQENIAGQPYGHPHQMSRHSFSWSYEEAETTKKNPTSSCVQIRFVPGLKR